MELTGSLASQAERQQLWDALINVQNWKDAIPDAQKLEQVSDDLYEMEVKVDIGPIKGNQTLKIRFLDQQPPNKLDFELQNSMVKEVKGNFELKNPDETVEGIEVPSPLPDGTRTVLYYRLNVDAGNPFFNAMLEGYKGRVKDGFDELLGRLEQKARSA